MSLGRDQLAAGPAAASMEAARSSRGGAPKTSQEPPPPARIGGIVETDLRGLRVDEALDRLDAALDLAAAEGRDEMRIIHGIGTGALRKAVREALPRSHYVVECIDATRDEGGAGALRAILRKD